MFWRWDVFVGVSVAVEQSQKLLWRPVVVDEATGDQERARSEQERPSSRRSVERMSFSCDWVLSDLPSWLL